MKPPIIYARISPSRENKHEPDPESIDRQIERCQLYLKMLDIEERPIIIKDVKLSARLITFKDRPGGGKATNLLQSGRRMVVATKLDRLFRSTVDGISTLEKWAKKDIAVHLASEGGVSIDTSTANGKLCASLLLSVNAHEAERTAERTSEAMLAKQKLGVQMSSQAPYGWQLDRNNPGKLVEDAEEQKTIRDILAWNKEGLTVYRILKRLNDAPHRHLPRGSKFYYRQVKAIIERANA